MIPPAPERSLANAKFESEPSITFQAIKSGGRGIRTPLHRSGAGSTTRLYYTPKGKPRPTASIFQTSGEDRSVKGSLLVGLARCSATAQLLATPLPALVAGLLPGTRTSLHRPADLLPVYEEIGSLGW